LVVVTAKICDSNKMPDTSAMWFISRPADYWPEAANRAIN
jgi:hypothetical protein